MAKRHHHMKKHHGMHGHYEGHEGRRRQEMKDAGMIHEDKSAIANLPQNVMIKDWPKGGYGMEGYLDDSISGIDRQMDMDVHQRSKHNKPHKY